MNSQVEVVQLSEAAELAKIMSGDSAKQIIDYIAEHEDCTASEIAKKLKIPASTVHYNLKALTKSNILDDSHFTYSSKGKTVINYRLANKVIIIVPEEQSKSSLLSQLSTILPGLLGVIILAGIGLFASFFRSGMSKANLSPLQDALPRVASESPTIVEEMVADFAVPNAGAAPELATKTTQAVASNGFFSSDLSIGLLIGAGIILLGAIAYILLRKKKA